MRETELQAFRRKAETSNSVATLLYAALERRDFCGPLGRPNGRTARRYRLDGFDPDMRRQNARQKHLPISERVISSSWWL